VDHGIQDCVDPVKWHDISVFPLVFVASSAPCRETIHEFRLTENASAQDQEGNETKLLSVKVINKRRISVDCMPNDTTAKAIIPHLNVTVETIRYAADFVLGIDVFGPQTNFERRIGSRTTLRFLTCCHH
jgi:hypothetical protein